MARAPRSEECGAVHHVYARGNRAATIFEDGEDRRRYLRLVGRAVRRHGWHCLAYCLMTNHLHLLIETPQPNLGRGMQRLHGDYATAFNKRHGHVGHVFQGRYGAVRITDDEHLVTAARYIAVNPVEAGLCSLPEDWVWSSVAAQQRGAAPPWLAAHRLAELAFAT